MLHAVLGRPVPLHVVGANTEAHRDEWPAEYVQVVGWVEDLVDVFVDCGVFVAPLRYGAGTKGKVTAALSHGRPIITTPVGAEGFDDDVASALLVTDDATTMVEMLASLITDDAAWEERASATRKAAEDAWGAERASELLLTQWLDRRVRYRPVVV